MSSASFAYPIFLHSYATSKLLIYFFLSEKVTSNRFCVFCGVSSISGSHRLVEWKGRVSAQVQGLDLLHGRTPRLRRCVRLDDHW